MTSHSGPAVRFLVHSDALGPIFSSVYLNPAASLGELGLDSGILALSSVGEFVKPKLVRRWRTFAAEAGRRLGSPIQRLPTAPKHSRVLHWDAQLIAGWARRFTRGGGKLVLHCGGSYAACVGIEARRRVSGIGVVYQSWGPEAAEILHGAEAVVSGQVWRRARAADGYQRRAMQEADVVVSISRRMTGWAKREFALDERKVVEIPCFVDTGAFDESPGQREAVRQALGLGDDPVIAYCGSMLSWQLPPRSLEVLCAAVRLNPKARFLGITMHADSLRRRLAAEGFSAEQAVIVSVPHWEVPRYLAAADLGIIGRGLLDEPSLVNAVSSPIKFGEYLACGTPVLIGEGVGDFSQAVKDNALGVTLPFHATPGQVEAELKSFWSTYADDRLAFRQRCRDFARRELDTGPYIRRLAAVYEGLSADGQAPGFPAAFAAALAEARRP